MPLEPFRTKEELTRTRWAEKFLSVSEGKLYTKENDSHSPFPIHKYFQNKLLGDTIKMLEVNAGAALVEQFVADTLTELTITVDGEENTDQEKEIREWYKQVDYDTKEEEACRSLYGNGFGVQQLFRLVEGDQNTFTVATLDPSTWYPDIPTFHWQKVDSGRIITVFCVEESADKQWYAFVEKHEAGLATYKLLKLEKEDATDGVEVPLSTLGRFEGLDSSVNTDLDRIPIFQADRQKSSRHVCGTSLLYPIWDILQEISEIQTQLRQERIKHLKAKFAAPLQSLNSVVPDKSDAQLNSKQLAARNLTQNAGYNANQEIFPIPPGGPVPQYIQRDLQSIQIGLELIDSLLAKAASIVGCPKSVFNLEESAGNVKVDTEKRKDRRYVRKILQGQWQMAKLREDVTKAWWKWSHGGEELNLSVTYQSPFNLSQEEIVALAKEMNPTATLISEEDAVEMVHADKTPEERERLIQNIRKEAEERRKETMNALDTPPDIVL